MALMAKITYKPIDPQPVVVVYLDGKRVGTIYRTCDPEGYFYQPLSSDVRSKSYPTLDAMKASLEGRDEP
jgi:hypothetical protein